MIIFKINILKSKLHSIKQFFSYLKFLKNLKFLSKRLSLL